MITVLIALGVITLGIFSMTEFMTRLYRQERLRYLQTRVRMVQNSMISLIRADTAWQATISHSANTGAGFSCFSDISTCPPNPTYFALFSDKGAQLSDPGNPGAGLDLNGEPCATFSKTTPDARCPLRYNFSWIVDCTSCAKPAPKVTGELEFSYPENIPLNPDFYKMIFTRGKEIGTVAESCASMKGIYNQVTGKCELPFVGVECLKGKSMNGTDSKGSINCQSSPGYFSGTCPPGNKPVGINSVGEIVCAARP